MALSRSCAHFGAKNIEHELDVDSIPGVRIIRLPESFTDAGWDKFVHDFRSILCVTPLAWRGCGIIVDVRAFRSKPNLGRIRRLIAAMTDSKFPMKGVLDLNKGTSMLVRDDGQDSVVSLGINLIMTALRFDKSTVSVCTDADEAVRFVASRINLSADERASSMWTRMPLPLT